jgi:ABC-type molybdenum transport system ATPase subunit/photorepair protein PhrA
MLERLAEEEGYVDEVLDVHTKVEATFSQLVLSALFGVSTFLANVVFAASHIDEKV